MKKIWTNCGCKSRGESLFEWSVNSLMTVVFVLGFIIVIVGIFVGK